MKVQSLALSLCLISATGIVAYGSGRYQADANSSKKTVQKMVDQSSAAAKDEYVGVYITSVARQIKMSDLAKTYPAQQAGLVDKRRLAADTIVGWYDKGHNFHAQKMQNNIKVEMGATRILPQMLRGTDLRGEEASQQK